MDRSLFERITCPEKRDGHALSGSSDEHRRNNPGILYRGREMPLEARVTRPAPPMDPPEPPVPPAIHPSFVRVAKPYMAEQVIQACIRSLGIDPIREEKARFQGVSWIDNVRKELNLYVLISKLSCSYAKTNNGMLTRRQACPHVQHCGDVLSSVSVNALRQ